MTSDSLSELHSWVEGVRTLTEPDAVEWLDGSEAQANRLVSECLRTGELVELNQTKLPGCYLHRSAPDDVARTEHLTFVCTDREADAGPNNNWMAPVAAESRLSPIFRGCMKGRTMYVVPFLMGPAGSPFSRAGIEITDSRYVALSMRIMTRVGGVALSHIAKSGLFTRCLHSIGDLSPERRFIVHFPERDTVWSIGSGYGGNALLGKKCMALRLASWAGRRDGWLAEHMLIVGVQNPAGELSYIAGAFPSACGKTDLAMLTPPESMSDWKVWTVGDDIAWLRPGPDGRLWALNPEAGFFGVAPGTSRKTNPVAFDMIQRNTIFTNVALRPDGTPWWEGHDDPPPTDALDWQGRPWTPGNGVPAAHPNSRFTTPMRECASLTPNTEEPNGVPIDAVLFGTRRSDRVPLIYQARNWAHGVFLGATMMSETTSAASGAVGVSRRDPMAMLPFCGYNIADYFEHWLSLGRALTRPPAIFRVNWFRQSEGRYLWPGFHDNLRVLKWVVERCQGRGEATETAIGLVPAAGAIDRNGLGVSDEEMADLLRVDPADWLEAAESQELFFGQFGDRLGAPIRVERDELLRRLRETAVPVELRSWLLGWAPEGSDL